MASPFHDYLWRNAHPQRITNKRPSASMSANEFVFWKYDVNTFITLIVGLSDRLVDFCFFA